MTVEYGYQLASAQSCIGPPMRARNSTQVEVAESHTGEPPQVFSCEERDYKGLHALSF